jgi:hypothetical protein
MVTFPRLQPSFSVKLHKNLSQGIPVCSIDTLVFSWIFWELKTIIEELKSTKQTFRLQLFQSFQNRIFLYFVICSVWMTFEVVFAVVENFSTYWYLTFLFNSLWEYLYFFGFFSISIIWKPFKNNQRYVASQQVDGEDKDSEMNEISSESKIVNREIPEVEEELNIQKE